MEYSRTEEWPDPTEETLSDERFNAVWDCIKTWDVNVSGVYQGYCGASGNHVRAILDALDAKKIAEENRIKALLEKMVAKWNSDLEFIQAQIMVMDEDPGRVGKVFDGHFCWSQIVWQECKMYASIGKPVNIQEFDWLCKVRGLRPEHRDYIKGMIDHLELGWFEAQEVDEKQFYPKFKEVEKEIAYESKGGR